MAYEPTVNPGFTEPDDAPPFDDDSSPAGEVEPKPKRQVSYNQRAVLCHACQKRIRLNNNGCLRLHVKDKAGSDKCVGSNAKPQVITSLTYEPEPLLQKSTSLFSDPE